MALVLPSLAVGFIGDDYMQIAQLERWSPVTASPLDLYVFVPRDAAAVERLRQEGILPYFSAPELKIAFLRPLTSALMWLDHTLFERRPPGYHVHTLLWFGGLLLVVAALLRRALPGGLAVLALLLFCLDDAHAMAAGWIAARNATISCALVFLGLWAHLRWRTEGWRAGAVLAPLAVALGLAAGEMGLGALAYLFAWELVGRPPDGALPGAKTASDASDSQGATLSRASDTSSATVPSVASDTQKATLPSRASGTAGSRPRLLAGARRHDRLRALAPSMIVAAIYLVAHRLTGSGARAGGGYLDPFGDPAGTLRALPERVLLLVGNLVVGAPIDLLLFDDRLRLPVLALGGLVVVALAVWLPRALARMPAQEARAVRWFGLGAAGALLVSVPALIGERVLLAASLGGAVVLAALLRDAWRRLRPRAGATAPTDFTAVTEHASPGREGAAHPADRAALAPVSRDASPGPARAQDSADRDCLGSVGPVAPGSRDMARSVRDARLSARVLAAVGLVLLALPNLVVAPLLMAAKVQLLRRMSTDYQRLAGQAEIEAPVPARVVVVALPDLVSMHLPVLRVFDQGVPPEMLRRFLNDRRDADLPLPDRIGYRNSTVLSLSSARHRLRRTAADTLELATPDGTLLDGAWAQALRSPALAMPRGQVIPVSYMTATVLEDRGGLPTRVQLRFDRSLDDPSLVFLALSKGRLRRLPLPAVGQEIAVPQDPALF